jgi:hypothetical protein
MISSAAASGIRSPWILIDWFTNAAPLIHISAPENIPAHLRQLLAGRPDRFDGVLAPPIPRTARRRGVRGELSNWFFQLIGWKFFSSGMILFLRGSWQSSRRNPIWRPCHRVSSNRVSLADNVGLVWPMWNPVSWSGFEQAEKEVEPTGVS